MSWRGRAVLGGPARAASGLGARRTPARRSRPGAARRPAPRWPRPLHEDGSAQQRQPGPRSVTTSAIQSAASRAETSVILSARTARRRARRRNRAAGWQCRGPVRHQRQPAAVMVDHHRQVAVVALIRRSHRCRCGAGPRTESSALFGVRPRPGPRSRPRCARRSASIRTARGFRTRHRQPGHRVIKRIRVPGVMARPRHRHHGRPRARGGTPRPAHRPPAPPAPCPDPGPAPTGADPHPGRTRAPCGRSGHKRRHHQLGAVSPLLVELGSPPRSPCAYRHPTAHAITSHCARRCPLLRFLTLDKPETLSDNDVRLFRPQTHPRNGQKSPRFGRGHVDVAVHQRCVLVGRRPGVTDYGRRVSPPQTVVF